MKIPWLIRVLFVTLPRNAWILFMHGGRAFCWHVDCWNLVWEGCHATERTGNGRMCKEHCEQASYHNYWYTDCAKAARFGIDERFNAEKRAREQNAWQRAKDVTPKQKTLKA